MLFCVQLGLTSVQAQNVNINATGGTPFATYPTLNAAFTAINNGVHTGQILVSVIASTNEGATSAVLNASGTGAASYTKLYMGTTQSNAVVSGAPASGAAVVQLNGADNVTINGAQNASGFTRNLTIENTVAAGTTLTAAIWVRSNGTALGCTNDTIMNCIIRGNDATNTTATSTYGLYVAGTTISTTGSGADNDGLKVLNNEFRRAWVAMFARGTAAGVLDNLVIGSNWFGSTTAGEQWGRNGIDLQQAASPIITLNEIGPTTSSSPALMFGLELGTGTTTAAVTRNNVHDIVNLGSSGSWGLNIAAGTGHVLANNFISGIKHSATSVTSSTTVAAGIRINGGTGHQILYNSINLYGTTTHTGVGHSAGLVITTTAATGLNIRNNIFANSMTFPVAGSEAHGVLIISAYNFTTAVSTINNNGYFVPASNTATTSYYVGSQLAVLDHVSLANWAGYTTQDAASVPYANGAATFFTSNSNLHVTGAPLIIESAGFNIAGITADYDNQTRQGNGGYSQVPAGTAPDIGADEFASTPADFVQPTITAVSLTPGAGCTAVSHTVQATLTDASGIGTAVVKWFLNGVAQTDINMTNLGGGVYNAIIPASGSATVYWFIYVTDASAQANSRSTTAQTYQDAYLQSEAGPADSVCAGGSVQLQGSTSWGNSIKITEITQFSTGTGATTPYPPYIPATGFEDYIELSNLGNVQVDISGYTVFVEGITTRQYTFPAGTFLPAGAVAVLHIGSSVPTNLANRVFSMGGADNIVQSGSITGYYIKNSGGKVIDAVGSNGHVFSTGSGVQASDWSGSVAGSSGRAGIIRTAAADNNVAADWVPSNTPTPLQTVGSLNPGLNTVAQPTATWDGSATNGNTTISPGTSGYHYFVVTDGVCTSTDSVFITVLTLPVAPVSSGDTICGIDTAHISAVPVSGTIRWYDAAVAGNLLASGNTYSPYVSATTTFYAEDFNGTCAGPRTATVVTVLPADTINGSANSSTFCEFDPITLTAASPNTSYVYNWSGASIVPVTGNPATTTVSLSGPIFVEAIDSAGCRAVDTLSAITVNPAPVGSLWVSDSSTQCIGGTDTVWVALNETPDSFYVAQATAIIDNATVNDVMAVSGLPAALTPTMVSKVCMDITHSWDSDMNISLISPTGTIIDLSSGNGGSGDNYTNTCFDMSAGASIVAGTAPFTGSYVPEGAGGFANFAGENPNGNWTLRIADVATGDQGTVNWWYMVFDLPAVTYSWTSSPAGFTSSSDSIAVAPDTTTTYTLTITDTATLCTRVLSYTVPVYPEISVAISGPTTYCAGSSTPITLTSTVSGGNGVYTYDWNGLGSADSLNVTVSSDTSFVLSVMDSCSTPVASDTIFINANPALSSVTSADTTVCPGDSVLMTVIATGGDGNYTYNWSSGGNAASEAVAPTSTTTYTVTVTDGCSSTSNGDVVVTVTPLPVASFTFSPSNPQEDVAVNFTNTSTNATSYAWTLGSAGTSTLANPSATFPNPGNQTITLIATNSCGSDTTSQSINILLSMMDGLAGGTVMVYPNPGDGLFHLNLQNLSGKEASISVFDLRGEQILSRVEQLNAAVYESEIDLSAFTRGVYFLKVTVEGQSVTSKLVLQ